MEYITIVTVIRGVSRTAATSKMEHLVIIVNGWKLGVAAALDPPLVIHVIWKEAITKF